ncbi:FtsB family cell division protein [Corynebacterium endometrii]|uniref:Cell division protein FtsB n=1 Tax=Corynebacterium endometrii TaxID=2488819 RepID=A0A4P7QEK6_9CORY|nr:septum formation initiator family protein [Corynebacterium endometrii]QCB28102.1 cell division protein FtsB [Corynebacterium endometrii]
MASANKSSKPQSKLDGGNSRRRNSVPVASRAADRASREREAARAKELASKNRSRMDIAGVSVLIAVVLIILFAIAVPLRNYYDGRTELARLNESIASAQQEKERLQTEIERYQDPEYIRQEARRRLGLVAPGEVAYRIVDPRMSQGESLSTDKQAESDQREWYEVLWDSVAEKPQVSVVSGNGPETPPSAAETAPETPAASGDEAEQATPAPTG